MDGSTLLTSMQMIVAWTLLGLLLTWLVIFAVLALRPLTKEKLNLESLPKPSRPFPALSAPKTINKLVASPLEVPLSAGAATVETSNTIDAAPIVQTN